MGALPEAEEVPAALDGQRIDRTVAMMTGLSRQVAADLVSAGQVAISGSVVTAKSARVREGDLVSVESPPYAGLEETPDLVPEPDMDLDVVWEDDQVLVVDKPPGLVVHPGAGNQRSTLVHGLLGRYPELRELGNETGARDRPGIVHRLDKGTSGLIVVARTAGARASLIDQFSSRSVERAYVALVKGSLLDDEGVVDAPLARSDRDRTRFTVAVDGRSARTRYSVRTRFDRPAPTTLLDCRLETGRTHQIRAHMAAIGHPVIGDQVYGGRSAAVWDGQRRLPQGRLFLHAATLGFDHPRSRRRLSFSSTLPPDLRQMMDCLA